MEIVQVDPYDDELVAEVHATYQAAERHGREETAASWSLRELRELWRSKPHFEWSERWAGLVDGAVVAVGWVSAPLLDNPTIAGLEVYTHPDHRSRGHAAALLAHLEGRAREQGRTTFTTECAYPLDAPVDGAGQQSPDFLSHQGYAFALGDIQRRLELPVDDGLLARLAEEAAAYHDGYELRVFDGPVPEDLAAPLAALSSTLMTEAPMGELDLEPQSPDVAIMRFWEDVIARQGRTKFTTVALHESGELAAYTDLAIGPTDGTRRAYQWGTLVARAHRGRRLGLAVKVANLAQLQAARPDAVSVTTWNAEVNSHMIGVNELLGFRPVERLGEFQKRL